jgi:hypothetical protein
LSGCTYGQSIAKAEAAQRFFRHAAEGAPYAVFSALSPSFAIVCSRITNFWILPVMVIGNSGTNSM